MKLFPAIDLYGGQAVRLLHGDYQQMTVYSSDPCGVAKDFIACGAENIHIVDLEGAKDGTTPNLQLIEKIASLGLFVEVGGGIRSEEVIRTYLDAGVFRVILGTVAVTEPEFTQSMVAKYGEQIAVGVDIRDGFVAIKGWTEVSALSCRAFCRQLIEIGVKTIICTDISKDGCLGGTNLPLYRDLSKEFSMNIVASGGVSTLDDVRALKEMELYGAILGKALYTGNIDLKKAINLCQ